MYTFTSSCKLLIAGGKPTVVYIVTDEVAVFEELLPVLQGTPLIVGTSSEELLRSLRAKNIVHSQVALTPELGLGVLDLVRELVERAFMEGHISVNDRVLCVVQSGVSAAVMYTFSDAGLARIKAEMGKRLPVELLEIVLQIAFQIAREGREGTHVGALLVVGDTEEVMKRSRARIINPFQGHPVEGRELWNEDNWHTIKAYAQLDGATLIDDKGVAQSAGRYLQYTWEVYLQGGLGGRHIAAASITKQTKAIAVVVSSSSVIRVFKDGVEIYKATAF